ncbi:hypothetical protein BABINDRAFT_98757 [Babjeviella inositovora NRRL Y-12698]|uniref:Uncharacterized protein n=1 Tax=Babjeviella inositovora NRRL Y-12698 TaxID=984486 RepID=A0A1E3QIL0_9ASCO|nr:uncharacterized protein BABINDRAFT_98757 [Babjeviella inositovora NRRL Y-12698]ODQ77480.1 hypothetical protein BABINDRAFT_98757 [Babjeviella inositovora NRRL Y-12698]
MAIISDYELSPYASSEDLPQRCLRKPIRIGILGARRAGKTLLAQKLASLNDGSTFATDQYYPTVQTLSALFEHWVSPCQTAPLSAESSQSSGLDKWKTRILTSSKAQRLASQGGQLSDFEAMLQDAESPVLVEIIDTPGFQLNPAASLTGLGSIDAYIIVCGSGDASELEAIRAVHETLKTIARDTQVQEECDPYISDGEYYGTLNEETDDDDSIGCFINGPSPPVRAKERGRNLSTATRTSQASPSNSETSESESMFTLQHQSTKESMGSASGQDVSKASLGRRAGRFMFKAFKKVVLDTPSRRQVQLTPKAGVAETKRRSQHSKCTDSNLPAVAGRKNVTPILLLHNLFNGTDDTTKTQEFASQNGVLFQSVCLGKNRDEYVRAALDALVNEVGC